MPAGPVCHDCKTKMVKVKRMGNQTKKTVSSGEEALMPSPQLAVEKKKTLVGIYIVLAIFALIVALPLIWLLFSSLKTQADLTMNTWGPPKQWVFSNYLKAWKGSKIDKYMLNSIIVTGLTIVITVVTVTPIAFVISRFNFKGKKILYFIAIAVMMIPIHSAIIPLYMMVGRWDQYNNLGVLSLIYAAFRIPISIFILEGFMTSLPRELEECAFIDGCSVFKLFFKIIVPLSKDGIVTISILAVLASWNELLVSMLLLSKPALKTLPIGLMGFITEYNSEYTQLAAGIMMAIIPSIVFYILAQEKIEKGMIAGAIKG
jgi:raffinose/stachyose/melibiose transport system permease protein